MGKKYILALDEGTTSCRAVLFDASSFESCAAEQESLKMIYPQPGWVEQDGHEIFQKQFQCAEKLLKKLNADDEVIAIGITNQRESVMIWDRKTGKPLGPCINWQCKRTASYCNSLKEANLTDKIKNKTGLVIDAYFSGSKLKWLLDNIPGARKLASEGKICAGTIDSYLVYRLTGGKKHITDITNASRTMLCNITDKCWDPELLELLDIPSGILPEITECAGNLGETEIAGRKITIAGMAGDQQSSLFGQACLNKGDSKCTYGTGAFVLINIGDKPIISKTPLITTAAYSVNGNIKYAFEGSVFNAGAVIEWIKDIGLIKSPKECDELAAASKKMNGEFFIPAFSGLGAPYWDMDCRGAMMGITRGTGRNELVRAALEGIAFRVADICELAEKTLGENLGGLRADGGAAKSNYLLQFQADLIDAPIYRSRETESTALGAAYLAAIGIGEVKDENELIARHRHAGIYQPASERLDIENYKHKWNIAVDAARKGNFN